GPTTTAGTPPGPAPAASSRSRRPRPGRPRPRVRAPSTPPAPAPAPPAARPQPQSSSRPGCTPTTGELRRQKVAQTAGRRPPELGHGPRLHLAHDFSGQLQDVAHLVQRAGPA